MAALGLDFGTSNCSAYVATPHSVCPAELENDEQLLPSVVFTARSEVAKKQIESNELVRRLKKERIAQAQLQKKQRKEGQPETKINDETLKKMVVQALEREAKSEDEKAYWDQTFFSMLQGGNAMLFGSPALRAYISDPLSGVLVTSPKSFLGSNINPEHLIYFEQVVVKIISHIKGKADSKAGCDIKSVVIGRPVNYHGTTGESGNKQAMNIMERAAKAAGFQHIEFAVEPVAAAFEYERTLQKEKILLVIDIGGGTTDCAVVRVGPDRAVRTSRQNDVLGYAGDRVGGTDFDQLLAWHSFMPLFGKDSELRNGFPVPHSILLDGISTRDIPAQLRFKNSQHAVEELLNGAKHPEMLSRLLTLQKGLLQHRLINSAELVKIKLTEQAKCTAPLGYIERGLTALTSRTDLNLASERILTKVRTLAEEAVASAGKRPNTVFVTGGMGMSPTVQDALKMVLGGQLEFEYGDMLSSVGKGLGLHAQRIYGLRN